MPKIKANKITMNYEQQGSGEPLILIPYLTADNACYAFQVAEYAKHFTCISLDLRGTGESDKPEGAYSTEVLADDVAAFMGAPGIPQAHICGLSLGAAIGMWLAANYPDTVKSLSLHSGWPKTDPYMKAVVEGFQVTAKAMESVPEMVILALFPWCLKPELYAAKPDYIQSLAAFVRSRPAQSVASFMQQSNAVITHDVEAQLSRIKAPTLITFGDRDVATSTRFADRMKGKVRNSELLIFEGCAHAPIYEKGRGVQREDPGLPGTHGSRRGIIVQISLRHAGQTVFRQLAHWLQSQYPCLVSYLDEQEERRRLAGNYASMTDGELLNLAEHAESLTEAARDALDDELDRRDLEFPDEEPPEPREQIELRNLITIRQFRDLPEALLAKGSLESAGIECFLADENLVRLDWFISNFIGGIKLRVKPHDAESAQKLLSEPILEGLYVHGVGLYEQPRCPNCQSLDVSYQELDKPIAYVSAFLRVPIPLQRGAWRCQSCDAEWEDDGSDTATGDSLS